MNKNSWCLLVGILLLFFPILAWGQAATTTESLDISVIIIRELPPTPPPPGVPWPPAPTEVIFEGKAYPEAFLTLLKNDKVAATFLAEDSGLFSTKITGLKGGTYTFGIWAEDTKGRRSATISITLDILERTTTRISGIAIPPTIEINPTQVERGYKLNIFGQSFPGSDINVFISPVGIIKQTETSLLGGWSYNLDTSSLEEGEYRAKAKALYKDGEQSQFSQELPFLVLPRGILMCQGADLNFDGKVDIVDFSILLYFWEQTNPANHCADINFDGVVGIFDFSIMMYWWSG